MKEYRCEDCDKVFDKKSNYISHRNRINPCNKLIISNNSDSSSDSNSNSGSDSGSDSDSEVDTYDIINARNMKKYLD
jgi:hypothetical protein